MILKDGEPDAKLLEFLTKDCINRQTALPFLHTMRAQAAMLAEKLESDTEIKNSHGDYYSHEVKDWIKSFYNRYGKS